MTDERGGARLPWQHTVIPSHSTRFWWPGSSESAVG